MYVFGGGDGRHWLNDLIYFDIKRLDWVKAEQLGELPEGRLQHAAFTKGTKLYIYGGEPD